MDSPDSDIEEMDKSRRGDGRKRLQQAAAVLEDEEIVAQLQVLNQRKRLEVLDKSRDEQTRRTSKLIDLLQIETTPPPRKKRLASNLEDASPSKLIKHHLNSTIRTEQAGWVLSEVDRVDQEQKPYWISQYMSNLPEFFQEPYNYDNVPKQIYTHAADAAIRTAAELTHINYDVTGLSVDLNNWCKLIEFTKERKIQLLRLRIDARDRYRMEPNALDEGCIWGLKPLRSQLSAPYLKTSDGLSAAPPHPNVEIWRSKFNGAPSELCTKQNWLGKDIAALKDAIRDVLIEKQLFRIRLRAGMLLKDCVRAKENELHDRRMKCMITGIDEEQPSATTSGKRGRGRPRKYGRQSIFAAIMPTLFTLPEGGEVRYRVNNADIQEWRDKKQDAIRKQKFITLLEKLQNDISWVAVAGRVTTKTRKPRSPLDCYLAFKYEADPKLNFKRWTQQELKKLQGLVEKYGIDEIEKICSLVGNNRSVFQCFQKWKTLYVKKALMSWDPAKDKQLNELVSTNGGDWGKIAFKIGDDLSTKNRVVDRFKKNTNPVMRVGSFVRVEDALLILTIEKLKPHLACEGHFGELMAYLPWRFETVWRDRAANLFSNFIVPWTVEEDKKLLELARTMKRDWRKIASTFSSFKNRKGCLTRWKILQKRLKKFGSVEAYHESYTMTRYNVLQYKHLNDILDVLKRVVDLPTIGEVQVSPARPPTDEELAALILAFNRSIMRTVIQGLEKYIEQRDDIWEDVIRKVNDRLKTKNKRVFHREDPQSMASALHMRALTLLPRNEIAFNMTKYQEDVYKYFDRISHTPRSSRKKAKRWLIPSVVELLRMSEVKDIVKPPQRGTRSGETNVI